MEDARAVKGMLVCMKGERQDTDMPVDTPSGCEDSEGMLGGSAGQFAQRTPTKGTPRKVKGLSKTERLSAEHTLREEALTTAREAGTAQIAQEFVLRRKIENINKTYKDMEDGATARREETVAALEWWLGKPAAYGGV